MLGIPVPKHFAIHAPRQLTCKSVKINLGMFSEIVRFEVRLMEFNHIKYETGLSNACD